MKDRVIYGEDYFLNQLNRGKLRKYLRSFYLRNIIKYNVGKAIDFGCGAGELLKRLPEGSLGLEINEEAVSHGRANNMNVELYDYKNDNYQFNAFKEGEYETIILSHVLEHLDDINIVFEAMIKSFRRMLIKKIIIVLPCSKGFKTDQTHKTYIEKEFFNRNYIIENGFKVEVMRYFPFNFKMAGNFFTYNELLVVLGNV